MCPLRDTATIVTIVALFTAVILIGIAEKRIKDPKLLKILKITDWTLTAGMFGYVAWVLLKSRGII